MNLNQLRFIVSVARSTSFSKAAIQCCVTQPSLSNAIAQFEEEIGGRLFVRTTRSVGLTPFGEHLIPFVEEILNAKEDLLKASKSFLNPTHKLIRIGMSPLINIRLVTSALKPFKDEHPDVDIVFKECLLDDLHKRLEEHKIDLAFLLKSKPTTRRCSHFFYEEPLYYLPKGGPDNIPTHNSSLTLSDIATESIIVSKGCGLADGIHQLFDESGYRIKEYPGQALSYKVLEEWAELGIGSAILPHSKISPQINAYPLLMHGGQAAKFTYETVWNMDIPLAYHITDILSYFKDVAPKLIGELAA